jgi:serine/threonine protein phosphatase 1
MGKRRRFVIGDIHGCYQTFRKLTEEILELKKEDTLFLLGDYIDRGPFSKPVLDHILHMRKNSWDVRPLMGNHEHMMLRSLDDPDFFYLWLRNGCAVTLTGFGVDPGETDDPDSARRIPKRYIDFCRDLPLFEETEDFLFVHAGMPLHGVNPGDDPDALLWSRSEEINGKILGKRTLIHGHTPVPTESVRKRLGDPRARVINLDTGCVYRHFPSLGYLSALDLDSMELFSLKNCDF